MSDFDPNAVLAEEAQAVSSGVITYLIDQLARQRTVNRHQQANIEHLQESVTTLQGLLQEREAVIISLREASGIDSNTG